MGEGLCCFSAGLTKGPGGAKCPPVHMLKNALWGMTFPWMEKHVPLTISILGLGLRFGKLAKSLQAQPHSPPVEKLLAALCWLSHLYTPVV